MSAQIGAREAAALLLEANDIHILCHKNPDGDALGSGYALLRALKSLGKRASLKENDPIPPKMSYLAEGIEEEDFAPAFIVSVDLADEQLFGPLLEPYRGKVALAIDHHPSNSGYAENLFLEPRAAAACESVYKVIRELGAPITPVIADCLYTGLATDTGCFTFSNTTAETHRIAAQLFDLGCRYQWINNRLFQSKSITALRAQQEIMDTLSLHFGGRVAMIVMTKAVLAHNQITEAELDGLASLPRNIEGVEIGITIKEREEGEYKLSLRSAETVNVSALCQTFGGGGHVRAAGCTICGSLQTVKEKILAAAEKALEEAK